MNINNNDFFQLVFQSYNNYANILNKTYILDDGYVISIIDFETMIALSENKKNQYNMAKIASGLNIATSSLTKSVKKLTKYGLTEKFHKENNKRDIIVTLSPSGEVFFKTHTTPLDDFFQKIDDMMSEDPNRKKYYSELLKIMISDFKVTAADTPNSNNLIPIENQ